MNLQMIKKIYWIKTKRNIRNFNNCGAHNERCVSPAGIKSLIEYPSDDCVRQRLEVNRKPYGCALPKGFLSIYYISLMNIHIINSGQVQNIAAPHESLFVDWSSLTNLRPELQRMITKNKLECCFFVHTRVFHVERESKRLSRKVEIF